MLRKATALPLCSVTDILWYRYVVSSGALVIVVIRLPRSSMNSVDCGHQAPLVSMATGTKECVAARGDILRCFINGCLFGCAQAVVEVSCTCDAAYVSGTVTSQASGTRVAPSGLLPSALYSPMGSLLAGICAFLTARQIRSLSCEWRMWRGSLLRQANPCRPLASTVAPHTHVWGWYMFVPSR